MKCPAGHEGATLTSPDYGQGAEFVCMLCSPFGRRFVSSSSEARAESEASRALSRTNADAYREARRVAELEGEVRGLRFARAEEREERGGLEGFAVAELRMLLTLVCSEVLGLGLREAGPLVTVAEKLGKLVAFLECRGEASR